MQMIVLGMNPAAIRAKVLDHHAEGWHLTPREKQIIGLSMEGRSRRQIVEELGISPKTCGNHITALLRKADATSVSELVIQLLLEAHSSN